jgi:CAAX amino terminal protease family.
VSKTFKLSAIFLITVVGLQIFRIVFSLINLSDNLAEWIFGFLFQAGCMGLLPALLYRAWISKDKKDYCADMRLNNKINVACYLYALIAGLLVFYINIGLSAVWYTFLTQIGYVYTDNVGTIYNSPEVLIFDILTTAMLPAFFEELNDRGLLLAALEGKSDRFKILFTGIFFGILHQNVAQLTPTMLGGLVMAYMAVKCSSIFPGMIVHFLNNFFIVILNFSMQTNGYLGALYKTFFTFIGNNFIIALLSWAAAIALLVYILKRFERLGKKEIPAVVAVRSERDMDEILNKYFKKADDFDKVYGYSEEKEVTAEKAPVKASKFERGLLYVSVFAALSVTIFTYVWGLLR